MPEDFEKIFEGIDNYKAMSFEGVINKAHAGDNLTRYDKAIEISTSITQDKAMLNYFVERFQQDAREGIPYNPLTNNCADFVRDTLKAGGIETDKYIIPNSYFKGVDNKADLHHYNVNISER